MTTKYPMGTPSVEKVFDYARVRNHLVIESQLSVGVAIDFAGIFRITGETILSNTLDVSDRVIMYSTLSVAKDARVSENVQVGNSLYVVNSSSLGSSLSVAGPVYFDSTLTVSRNAIIRGNCSVGDPTTLASTLSVAGQVTFESRVQIRDDLEVTGNITATSITYISTIDVADPLINIGRNNVNPTQDLGILMENPGSGGVNKGLIYDVSNSQFAFVTTNSTPDTVGPVTVLGYDNVMLSTLIVVGAISVSGPTISGSSLSVAGSLSVGGSTGLAGALNLDNTLSVSKDTILSSQLSVNGSTYMVKSVTLNSELSVGGATTLSGLVTTVSTLSVGRDVTVSGTLSTAGATTLVGLVTTASTLSVGRDVTVSGTLSTAGATTLVGLVTTASTLSVGRDVTVSGTLSTAGATTLATLNVMRSVTLRSELSVGNQVTIVNSSGENSLVSRAPQTLTWTGRGVFGASDNNVAVIGTYGNSGKVQIGAHASDLLTWTPVTINPGNDIYMVETAGNVGVGTITPGAKLHVSGDTILSGGKVTIASSLSVGSATTINHTLTVNRSVTVASEMSVGGTVTVSGNLSVSGAIRASSLTLTGNTLSVANTVTISSTLSVAGATTIGNVLEVHGSATYRSQLSVAGSLHVAGNAVVAGAISVANNIISTSSLSIAGSIQTGGGFELSGNVVTSSHMSVGGHAYIQSALSVTGDLMKGNIMRMTQIDSTLYIQVGDNTGTSGAAGDLFIGNWYQNTSASARKVMFKADGTVGIGTDNPTAALQVIGSGVFNSQLSVGANLRVAGSSLLTGAVSVANDVVLRSSLSVGENAKVTGTLNVLGSATYWSQLSVGGSVIANNLSVGVAAGYVRVQPGGVSNEYGDVSMNGYLRVRDVGTDGEIFTVPSDPNQNAYYNNGAGGFGIGTNNPSAKLHVVGSTLLSSGTVTIVSSLSTGNTIYVGGQIHGVGANGPLIIDPNYGANNYIQLYDRVVVAGTMAVTGSTTINSQLSVGGNTIVSASLSVSGVVNLGNGGNYNRLELTGGNSMGYLWSNFSKLGDGIAIGYNYHASGGSDVIPASGGETSSIVTGYGSIHLQTGATNVVPTTKLYVNSSGNVGVGTESPSEKFHIIGNSKITGTVSTGGSVTVGDIVKVNAGTSNSGAWHYVMTVADSPRWATGLLTEESGSDVGSDYAVWRYSDGGSYIGTPVVIQRSTGRVGIATSSPGAQLHVVGSTMLSGGTVTIASSLSVNQVVHANTSDGFLAAREHDIIGTETEFTILRTGNGSGIWGYKGASNNQGDLIFKTQSTQYTPVENMRINSAGNVGIGVSSPSAKLHVSGNTLLSGGSVAIASTLSVNNNVNINGTLSTSGDVYAPNITGLGNPTGTILMWSTSSAPSGYVICNGSAISRVTYAALFTVIGTTYGSGDGSTTFNVPDMQGRVAIGSSGTYTLANTGGAATHTLTSDEMPSHKHTGFTDNHNGHVHTVYMKGNGTTQDSPYHLAGGDNGGSLQSVQTGALESGVSGTPEGAHGHALDMNNTGGGQAHNNMQPYIVLNYIIKT